MPQSRDLVATVLGLLSGIGELRTRKMFGGVYIYCDNLFIATVHDETLYFKANEATAPDFVARGLRQFTYPKGDGMAALQYYEAPPEVFNSADAMQRWANKAVVAAKQSAMRKPRRGAKPASAVSSART